MRMIRENVERIAETQAQIDKLKLEGFKEMGELPLDENQKELPLGDMTVEDLRKTAKEKGLEGYSSLSKKELLALLEGM